MTADGGVSTFRRFDIHHREHKVHGEKQRRISVFSVFSMVKNFFIYGDNCSQTIITSNG